MLQLDALSRSYLQSSTQLVKDNPCAVLRLSDLDTVLVNCKFERPFLQRLRTCQEYIDREGLSQQSLVINTPKYHKRYILPGNLH
ncbi:hypothetical protein RHSIM_Rhsim03G0209900 [Rhododendron simsii]|uniref:Uncharacterized protein n=1 Tax=Rhododendron simsii TaxID=118357 RepID=A0A834HAP8_RHOSS|nr:hypothetical protein RHSIM_Rhsim03G0209900 [Rhododendron simsii]